MAYMVITLVLEHFLDQKGRHKTAQETEIRDDNDKTLPLLKHITGFKDGNPQDITERW